jgi:hypothetical protein
MLIGSPEGSDWTALGTRLGITISKWIIKHNYMFHITS